MSERGVFSHPVQIDSDAVEKVADRPLYKGSAIDSGGSVSLGIDRYHPHGATPGLKDPCWRKGGIKHLMISRGCYVQFNWLEEEGIAQLRAAAQTEKERADIDALHPGVALRFCLAPEQPGLLVSVKDPLEAEAISSRVCNRADQQIWDAVTSAPRAELPNAALGGSRSAPPTDANDFSEALEERKGMTIAWMGVAGQGYEAVHTFVIGSPNSTVDDLEKVELEMLNDDAETNWISFSKIEVVEPHPFWTLGIREGGVAIVTERLSGKPKTFHGSGKFEAKHTYTVVRIRGRLEKGSFSTLAEAKKAATEWARDDGHQGSMKWRPGVGESQPGDPNTSREVYYSDSDFFIQTEPHARSFRGAPAPLAILGTTPARDVWEEQNDEIARRVSAHESRTAESISDVRLHAVPDIILEEANKLCDLKTTEQMKKDLREEMIGLAEKGKRRPLAETDLEIKKLPEEVADFGRFMLYQASRDLGPRDVVKAYTITLASIQRQGLKGETLRSSWYNHPWSDSETIRPEDAFAKLLKDTPWGQSYLINAQKGKFDPTAAKQICRMMKPYGHNGLTPEGEPDTRRGAQASGLYWGLERAAKLAQNSRELLGALKGGSREDWIGFAITMHGIKHAKAGFIAALLGRGDVPTGDAREITNWAKVPKSIDRSDLKQMKDFVVQLGEKLRSLEVEVDPELKPFYEHLVHHYLWDLVGGTHTTHAELISCLSPLSGVPPLAVLSGASDLPDYL